MNRKDSGLERQSFSSNSNKDSLSMERTNTTAPRRRKSEKAATSTIISPQPGQMDAQRTSSESRSRPSRQDSTTPSSKHSGSQSKGRSHSSKPSSRRTSCTIVDPSRPSRHYRVRSSHSVPTGNGHDIDDALALHFRSCSLFANPSYQSNSRLPSPTVPTADVLPSPSADSTFNPDMIDTTEKTVVPKPSEETITVTDPLNATMHWTSPSTRRREYERIDRANSGIRGFFRKVAPRCVSGPPEKFYEKDQSDTGSVRRYRLDNVEDSLNEKEILRQRTVPCEDIDAQPIMPKKRWMCF